MIHDTILTIISKHVGSRIFLGYLSTTGNPTLEPINLLDVDKKGIRCDLLKTGTQNQYIPFYNDLKKNIFCFYNTNGIDLLIAKKVVNLADKLKDRAAQKLIINSLKGIIGQKVTTIFKTASEFSFTNGIFQNMGIAGITLSVPPFYNRTELLKYPQIYNIFDQEFNDLLLID